MKKYDALGERMKGYEKRHTHPSDAPMPGHHPYRRQGVPHLHKRLSKAL